MSTPARYIGLMSGTSLDAIDAAVIEISDCGQQLLHAIEYPIPAPLKQQIQRLCQPGENEIDRLGATDRELGEVFATAVARLLLESQIQACEIHAIGSHGQTVRHRPGLEQPFTLQIGDPNIIAQRSAITTVADFRRRDMAAGGQGAPLAPAFHQQAFGSTKCNRVILNIGGMANITPLIKGVASQGFDTGPGNVLLNCWIEQQQGRSYDRDGLWANSGSCIPSLLDQLLKHPFFDTPAPKSTGREDFDQHWLAQQLTHADCENRAACDIQATLLELSAQSISQEILGLAENVSEIYVCGGGAYNQALIKRLGELLAPITIENTAKLGIAAEWVEAAAFAWLAQRTLAGLSGNIPAATGASEACILGAIYPA